jgi:D-alanine-D-alanine ligase
LEQKGIEHTGSTKNAAKFGRFKDLAKQRVQSVGLKTADYILIKHGTTFDSNSFHLEFPVFVKPASLGGGQGIDDGSVVRSRSELLARISMLSNKFASDILIEEYLSGREFSVAVLMDEAAAKLQALPVEIIAGANMFGDRILGSSAKKLDEEVVIAVADMKIKNSITELAIGVFRAIGARDYGRIDIRLDKAGNPNFIEANLIPSLIRNYGNFPKACVINLGLQYEEMLTAITGLGLARAEAFEPIEQEYLCDSLLAVGS